MKAEQALALGDRGGSVKEKCNPTGCQSVCWRLLAAAKLNQCCNRKWLSWETPSCLQTTCSLIRFGCRKLAKPLTGFIISLSAVVITAN